jgi:triosephosphate isomerase
VNLFVANWKMHMTRAEARAYADELSRIVPAGREEREIVIAPPYTALDAVGDGGGRWSLGAQNVAADAKGAFTGEICARMLAEAGCRYVIVGHSERRRIFGEGAAVLTRKLARAREEGLVPIYCVGETESERDEGVGDEILTDQAATLAGDPPEAPLVIAYEPVWAIGTGRAASPQDAGTARALLRRLLAGRSDLRILYGGSVTPANAREMLEGSGMDGFLVGGASLDPKGFAAIAGFGIR